MDKNLIADAERLFKELQLEEVRLSDNGSEVYMKRRAEKAKAAEIPLSAPIDEQPPESDGAYSDCKEIKAPLVGIFHSSSSPDSPPFVKLGDNVKKGQTVCLIEAMKMMNEIKADSDGVILDVCAENDSLVEFGQTLFKLG